MMKAFSYAFVCTLMLSGCAVEMPETLERKHQDLIPAQWTSGEGKEAALIVREKPEQWWARWNNETLSFLVQKTLLNNTDIAQAQANLRSAQASLTQANSTLWPSFSIGGDATDQWKNHDWTQGYSAEAASKWSFNFGGRDIATQGAASATTKAQALTLEDTQSAVASEVVNDMEPSFSQSGRIGLAQPTKRRLPCQPKEYSQMKLIPISTTKLLALI